MLIQVQVLSLLSKKARSLRHFGFQRISIPRGSLHIAALAFF